MSGRARRLARLFRHADGRAILLPLDHGLWYGPIPGLERPLQAVRQLAGVSDGLLISPGLAQAAAGDLPSDRALALRVGASTSLSAVQDYEALFAGIETALRLDADALAHTLYLGGHDDLQALRDLGRLIEDGARYDLPVIAEFLPAGEWTWQQVAQWARLGFEMGAAVVKTIYTGQRDTFQHVVAGCPLPILIAGGPADGSVAAVVDTAGEAIEAGAAGLAIGRRIWQAPNPAGLLALLGRLIHAEITLAEAQEAVSTLG